MQDKELKAVGNKLCEMANALRATYGDEEAIRLLWAAAISLTLHARSKEHTVGLLLHYALELDGQDQETLN